MSLSKQRKMARKQAIADQKKNAVIRKVVLAVVCVLVIGGIIWAVTSAVIRKSKSVTADSNHSAQIDDNGMIKGVKASDYIKAADYNNIVADLAEIEYSDEDVDDDIEDVLEDNKYLDDSEELAAANGDTVNIDYAGTIDGEEFDGGSAEGYDLELGSGKFIDDFEAQIEGHHPGDSFDVEVTFPEDYGTAELAGKDAVFAVTLNSIYVKPEFTDEFVAEKLSEHASTVEEYRQYLKDKNYEDNLRSYVEEYVVEKSEITAYPKEYLKQLKANYKADEYSYYEYMNSLYSSYYGYTPYSSFADYLTQTYSISETEYDESLDEKVNEELKYALFCQSAAEAEGITVTLDEAREYYFSEGGTEENFASQLESYGTGYVVQQYLCEKVIKMICERTVVR
ncbi:MAG: FKBP-type peptidyl-prolyl cis-trans isomerase [Lachnospiraceae bacterium]|nr:FKBP-type peptidyl-prolyl cis-trans isomerase [Lachnospiraceae bacterium]